MLQFLRDSASTWVIKLVLWTLVVAFVGTIFLVWGYGDETGERPVATIAGSTITSSEFRVRYDNMRNRLRQLGVDFGGDFVQQLQMEKSTLDEMIMERLIHLAAEDAGFSVSDEEVQYEVSHNETFQPIGRFDKDIYFSILRNNNLTPHKYEDSLRRELLMRKISQLVTDSVMVTSQEIRDDYSKNNEQVNAKYMVLAPALFEVNIEVTDDAIAEYYEKNSARFQKPEERNVEYIFGNSSAFRHTVEVSEEELKAEFDANAVDYMEEGQVQARHILFLLTKDDSRKKTEEVMQKAADVLKEINDGADFVEMAKKHSEGPTAENGGDLGWFGKGKMVPEFEQRVFSMQPGEVSMPIRTRFGIHIIKLDDKKPDGVMPFEKAMPQLKNKILDKKSLEKAREEVSAILAGLSKSEVSMEEAAKAKNIGYSSSTVRLGEPVAGVPDSGRLVERAFGLRKDDHAGPIELDSGYYGIRLIDVVKAHTPEMKDIRDEVEKAFKSDESKRIAGETATKLLERLRGNEKFDKVADEMGLEARETGFIKRSDNIEGVASSRRFTEKAFRIKEGEFDMLKIADKSYLINVLARKAVEGEEYETERDTIKEKLLTHKKQEAVAIWRRALRTNAEAKGLIKIEPEYL